MPSTELPRIRACLFDMDGLLLNTEDIYTTITNSVLQEYGKPNMPWSLKAQLQGRPAPEATKIFHDWAHLPISRDEYAAKIAEKQQKLFPEAAPLPGVVKLLNDLHATSNTSQPVYIALATSSHKRNYELKTGHLQDLFSLFPKSRQVLGDDPRIGKGRGKPLPDIYLLALETINQELCEKEEEPIKPEECLVFEDAVPGVEAGRRAGMQVVWCPHPNVLDVYKGREEEVLAGLTGEHKEEEKTDAEKEADELQGERLAQTNNSGTPGKLNDGFARIFSTLENFPYGEYGIVIP
ncbi:HAD superfamily hydrolase, putative [Talaromyces stipitatus ATCC 10500]|uniref:HAD superfamily hydrolase, putative n=1 Tax=Talaromyces stipitatus (strain ATCC 10500 / CBS 375.48 / QM 6759 / NRRL 1006) TaxID=441959 RepID=B8MRL0_TALSN|nr:HAD superfamily hydrolase, putative [Talaromyces stipitatus ATCC 10500]EED13167.1 HAD superfamily hydrolase, putative [Talaromyces stipitatus ATCC 10500]